MAAARKEPDDDEDWIAAERALKRLVACRLVEIASRHIKHAGSFGFRRSKTRWRKMQSKAALNELPDTDPK